MTDIIDIEILDDGTFRALTDDVSGPNHLNAEQLLSEIGRLLGGEAKRERRRAKGVKVHEHLLLRADRIEEETL